MSRPKRISELDLHHSIVAADRKSEMVVLGGPVGVNDEWAGVLEPRKSTIL